MRWIWIIILIFCVQFSIAQQLQQYNLIGLNSPMAFPSSSYQYAMLKAKIHNRIQWLGFDNAPITNSISAASRIFDNSGVAFYFLNDAYGVFQKNEFSISYSHNLKISDEQSIVFGLGGKLINQKINTIGSTIHDQNDPIYNQDINTKILKPDADFGLSYIRGAFEAHLSAQNIIGTIKSINVNTQKISIEQIRYYNLLLKYKTSLNQSVDLYSSMFYSSGFKNPSNLIFSSIASIENKFNVGMAYNNKYAVVFILGYSHKYFSVFYTYDLIYNSLYQTNLGSHELLLTFNISTSSKNNNLYDLKGEKRGQLKNRLE